MVRLIPVERRGVITWEEDAPTHCGRGHRRLAPSHGACPLCGEPVRLWRCQAAGCDAAALYDDEHVHHSRKGLRQE